MLPKKCCCQGNLRYTPCLILLGKIFEGRYIHYLEKWSNSHPSHSLWAIRFIKTTWSSCFIDVFFSHVISVEITWNNTLPCVRGAAGLPPLYNLLNIGKTEICVASGCIFCASVKVTIFDIEQWGENCHSRHAQLLPETYRQLAWNPAKLLGIGSDGITWAAWRP